MTKLCVSLVLLCNLLVLTVGELIWSDEFDSVAGTRPSAEKWSYDLGDGSDKGLPGWGNGELQYYTDNAENGATDGDGHLVITALRSNSSLDCYYGDCKYTSARLVSKFAHMYGRFEARIKTPAGRGVWPAFWMLGENIEDVGWPKCGGIDVMQMKGSRTSKIYGGLQGPRYSGTETLRSSYTSKGKSFDQDFYTFAADWDPHRITLTVDDDVFGTWTSNDVPNGGQWVFDKPFQMYLNLAIGGSFDGAPARNETFPKKMYIDYIRVYDNNNTMSNEVLY